MGIIPGYTTEKTGTHGTVYFYNGSAAAQAVMASMVRVEAARAAEQEQSVQNLATLVANSGEEIVVTTALVSAIAASVGAAAAVAGTVAAVTSAGVGVASLVSQSEASGKDSLEILVENKTASPVVLSSYSTEDSTSVAMPGPIEPGQADKATVVNSSGPFVKSETVISLSFLAGGGLDADHEALTPIEAICTLDYNSSGVWVPTIAIDGCTAVTADDKASAFAAYFASGEENVMDLTIVAQGLEKGTAEAWFYFLPGSSTLEAS